MGAHLPPCRFRLDCSGADGRGATGQQQPVRAQWRDAETGKRWRDGGELGKRQGRRSEQAAPLPRRERIEGKAAVLVRTGGGV